MDWGELGTRPFVVEIWGTVAEWVGAVSTGLAALIAAGVYWRESNFRKSSQAKMINARLVDPHNLDDGKVHVDNYSDARIFDMGVEMTRMDMKDLDPWMIDPVEGNPDDRMIEQAKQELNRTSIFHRYVEEEAWSLKPGESATINIWRYSPYQVVSFFFRDAKGRSWRIYNLRGERPRLQPVVGDLIYPKPQRFVWLRHPIETFNLYRIKLRIRRWDKKDQAARAKAIREMMYSTRTYAVARRTEDSEPIEAELVEDEDTPRSDGESDG